MNFGFRKLAVTILSVSIAFGTVVVPSYATSGYSDLADSVGYIYNYLDEVDTNNINNTKYSIGQAKPANVVSAVGSDLITDELVGKFANATAARNAVAQLLKVSLGVYFSNSTTDFENALEAADSSLGDVCKKIFGDGSTKNWLKLFTTARKKASATHSYEDRHVWALGAYTEVYDSLDELQVKNMDLLLASCNLDTAFAEIGWTSRNVVEACRNIMGIVDNNHVGEWALIKAAARSAASVEIDGSAVALSRAGADLEDSKNIIKYSPDELPKTIEVSLIMNLDNGSRDVTDITDVTVTGGSADVKEAEVINTTTEISFQNKGIYDVTLQRISGVQDWLSRFRLVFAYDISPVVWNDVNSDEGTVTFNSVDHAVKYVVDVYKDNDNTKIATKTFTADDTLKIDFSEWTAQYGSGNYYAKAVAYGDLEEIEYSKDSTSGTYTFKAAVGDVGKPVWEKNDQDKTYKLKWEPVDNAAEYIVTVTGGDLSQPIVKRVPAIADTTNSLDFTTDLTGKYGSFYATVQAVNGDEKGAISPKSDALVIERLYSISGVVVLEGKLNPEGTERADNSGTRVTIKEVPGVFAISDANGNYSFEGLPYVVGGYNLVYEHGSYLRSKRHVGISLNNMNIVLQEREFLYFGDFYNNVSGEIIDVNDLTRLVARYNFTTSSAGWDEQYSLGDDTIIRFELPVLLRNFGKDFNN